MKNYENVNSSPLLFSSEYQFSEYDDGYPHSFCNMNGFCYRYRISESHTHDFFIITSRYESSRLAFMALPEFSSDASSNFHLESGSGE